MTRDPYLVGNTSTLTRPPHGCLCIWASNDVAGAITIVGGLAEGGVCPVMPHPRTYRTDRTDQ